MKTQTLLRSAPAGLAAALLFTVTGCSRAPLEQSVNAEGMAAPPAGSRPSAAAKAVPTLVVIPVGTRVSVRTAVALSTKTARTGQAFESTLEQPLSAGGKVVLPRGAVVRGVVAESNPGGRLKGAAHIAVRLTEVRLADGRQKTLRTNVVTRHARRTRKRDAMTIGIGSGLGAAVGAIAGGGVGAAIGAGAGGGAGTAGVLLTRGAPAVIPAESLLTFTLRDPLTVQL